MLFCKLFYKGSRGTPPWAVGAARWFRDLWQSSRVFKPFRSPSCCFSPSYLVIHKFLTNLTGGFLHFAPRVNLDSVQSEANALLKRLNETAKKVSNSVEEVKEQYVTVLEVGEKYLPTIKALFFAWYCCWNVILKFLAFFFPAGKSRSMSVVMWKAHCTGGKEERVGSLLVRGQQSAVPRGTFWNHQDLQGTFH